MNKTSSIAYYITLLLLTLQYATIQAQDVTLDLFLGSTLENANVLGINELNIDKTGSGNVIISGQLENNTDQTIEDLYFQVIIRSSRSGKLVEVTQERDSPFSLLPEQSVYATNNDIANERLPGVRETIRFSGGLTTEGENLYNSLGGTTILPNDIYTIEVILFQQTNSMGRVNLASSSVEFGNTGSGSRYDDLEIYLQGPGGAGEDEYEITNPYPHFSWEGDANLQYRLIVVSDDGDGTPESLIQVARSSPPTNENGSLQQQYEYMDMMVRGDNFQYPSSGVRALQAGKTYHWQVFTTLRTAGDTEVRSSEIWTFRYIDTGSDQVADVSDGATYSEDMQELLTLLLGEETLQDLTESGYTLEEVEFDGQVLSASAFAARLDDLLQRIRDNEMFISKN